MTTVVIPQEQAVAEFGRSLTHLRQARDMTACEGGPEAVAERACKNGSSEDRARIAAHYAELQRQVQAPTAAAV